LLSNNSDVFCKCQLVDVKIANRNFAEAQIIVDSLRNVDNGAHTQFCEFRDLLIQIEQEVDNCFSAETNSVYAASINNIRSGDINERACLNANILYAKLNASFILEEEPNFIVVKSATLSTEEMVFNIYNPEIKMYPNPASDFVTFDLDYEGNTVNAVIVYDLLGARVKNVAINIEASYMDVSLLSSRTYVVSFELSNGEVMNQKMIIKK
jgi:hypothetical protein